jgi:glycosyltransferase involved in cell wall biosynthesis
MKGRLLILGDSSSNHIIRWAKGAESSDYETAIVSCGGSKVDGVKTLIFGKTSGGAKNFLRYTRKARQAVRDYKPDLIHAFQVTGYGHWGAGEINCPKILTPLGSDIVLFGNRGFLHRRYIKYILKNYGCFTTASRFLMNEMNKRYPVTGGKTSVVPFGVELPDFCREHEERFPVRIVYMRHLLPVYGPHILLEAARIVKDHKIDVTLDMYGRGYESDRVQRLAEKLDVISMVNFKGWVHMDKVMATLAGYDLMVMPSLSEAFGVAAVEASAVGLPVVASNVGGLPEIVRNEQTGLLVPPGDPKSLAAAIMRLVSNADLRKKFGKAGREYVSRHFRWHDSLNRMHELYDKLISMDKKR